MTDSLNLVIASMLKFSGLSNRLSVPQGKYLFSSLPALNSRIIVVLVLELRCYEPSGSRGDAISRSWTAPQ